MGVDLGSRFLRLAVAEGGPDEVPVLRGVMAPTPPGSLNAAGIHDPAAVASVLCSLRRELGADSRMAAIALPASCVIMRRGLVAAESGDPESAALGWLAETGEDLAVSVQALDEEAGGRRFLVVGARRSLVASHVEVVRAAGLEPLAVDVDVLAAVRACPVRESGERLVPAGSVFVHTGSRQAVAVFPQGDWPILSIDLPAHPGTGSGLGPDGIVPPDLAILSEAAGRLASGLRLLCAGGNGPPVSEVFLSGGWAAWEELPVLLAADLDLPVHSLSPSLLTPTAIGEEGRSTAPFAVAVGLALHPEAQP